MHINTNFTDEDWARIERDWTAWWRHELGRPLVMLNGLDLKGRMGFAGSLVKKLLKLRRATFWDQLDHPVPTLFPLDAPAEEVIEAYGELLSGIRCFGDCWPRWWPNFGPGIMAGYIGGRVNSVPGTVWFDRAEPVDLGAWLPQDEPANPWRQRILELTRLAVERWGGAVSVGVTDLGGNLDILASLRGTQQLLLDTIEQPESVARLSGEITRLWLRYYDELYELIRPARRGTTPWAHVWSPGRTYMLQCDFSYMISPAMFERFVLPDLDACCRALDHAFYHLDGKGEIPHLDLLLSLPRLRGIQWIPGDGSPPPEKWLPLLKRIRDGGKLCQLYVSPEGALEIVRGLGGKGFALYIDTPMSRSRAEAYLKTIMSAST